MEFFGFRSAKIRLLNEELRIKNEEFCGSDEKSRLASVNCQAENY